MPDIYVAKGENPQPKTTVDKPITNPEPVVTKTDINTDAKTKAHETILQVLERAGEHKRALMFHSYVVTPQKKFISEQDDEEVVLLLRAHPITNLRWILLVVLMLIMPYILTTTGALALVPVKYLFVGKLAWYLLALGVAFEKFLDWYYSVFIVTNERIVDVDFVNLLYRVVSYANLNHIEEPSMVAGGFIRSIFHYGDVFVATAAEQGAIEGLAVPYPDRVIRIISELSEELEKSRQTIN